MLALAVALAGVGVAIVAAATRDRRRRWRRAEPFAGDERAAPEPVLVPRSTIYVVYAGWLLVVLAGAGAVAAATVS